MATWGLEDCNRYVPGLGCPATGLLVGRRDDRKKRNSIQFDYDCHYCSSSNEKLNVVLKSFRCSSMILDLWDGYKLLR